MKPDLRKRAYREAAALLASDMDRCDFDRLDLTEADEARMREFIRTVIVAELTKKGTS